MQLPITIGLCRSRMFGVMFLLIAVLALMCWLATPFGWPIRFAGLVPIVGIAFFSRSLLNPQVAQIRLGSQGEIMVRLNAETAFVPAVLLSEAIVHPQLVCLRLGVESGRVFWLSFAVDSLKVEDFRRLSVFMRWRAGFGGGKDAA